MTGESVIDVSCAQHAKSGQHCSGDVFLSRRIKEEGRVIAVLSDGLGSGVKASVLANLTATMALKYTASAMDVRTSARTIMDTLPICEVRKISYSTFTIIDTDDDGATRAIEHGNPDFVLMRGPREIEVAKDTFTLEGWRDRQISYGELHIQLGDRIICCSDGISQSGLGRPGMPLGWRRENIVRFAAELLNREKDVSSACLARELADKALANDGQIARDDITCAVIHFRQPRRLLIVTGPPFNKEMDADLGHLVETYPGRTAICGGTTAEIVGRALNRPVRVDLSRLHPDIPPPSLMPGVDLVTEGTLTLAKAVTNLESGTIAPAPTNAVDSLLALMLDSDMVDFVVGTRINEAHQDPNVPVELDLRRNIIRRAMGLLELKYLKQVSLRFV